MTCFADCILRPCDYFVCLMGCYWVADQAQLHGSQGGCVPIALAFVSCLFGPGHMTGSAIRPFGEVGAAWEFRTGRFFQHEMSSVFGYYSCCVG